MAQRVCRGIALLFLDRGARRGWVVSSTPRPHFTPGKDPVPILQEAGWAPGPAWTGGKSRPHRDSIPGRPARSQSLYRLSYPAHLLSNVKCNMTHELMSWTSVSHQIQCKSHFFFFISACNSKCITVCCSGCFILYYALLFIPFFLILLQSSKSEHIKFCLIQYQSFMSSAIFDMQTLFCA